MKTYQFDCGCAWPVLDDNVPDGVMPRIAVDPERLPLCPAVWELISRGETKGVFQLESKLGKQWAKRLRPNMLEHLSGLAAILRPGCLKAVDEHGISMTAHYCKRKNGEEPMGEVHGSIKDILAPTYNVMTYQEQAMLIAAAVAGFDLKQADTLRKAIGKKKADIMAEVKKQFIDGAKEANVIDEELAQGLWSWIEKSQRYSFNRCLHKDTVIRRPNGGRFLSKSGYTVEEMYRIRNDLEYAKSTGHEQLRRKWNRLGNYGKGLSLFEDGRIRPNTIVDIQPSGILPVFRVVVVKEDGGQAQIEASENHKFPTSEGELTLSEIMKMRPMPKLIVCGEYEQKGYPSLEVNIESITPVGEVETYDVTMDAPNHNLVVDGGIVTCNSHSYCYGLTGYDCAYLKAHLRLPFFTAWLEYAKDKPDPKEEVAELVNDAKRYDIRVGTPDLRQPRAHFFTDYRDIKFGLADIKGIGEKEVIKVQAAVEESKKLLGDDFAAWTWDRVLVHVLPQFTSTTAICLVKTGALDWLDVSRQKMLYEYEIFQTLSYSKKKDGSYSGERIWVQQESVNDLQAGENRSFLELLTAAARPKKEGGACSNKNRVAKLQGSLAALKQPIVVLQDSPLWIATTEEELLGISLTCSLTDTCDMGEVNTTVKEFADGRDGFMVLGVVIRGLRVIKTKKGKNPGQKMAFMTVEDPSGTYEECVCFPDAFKEAADFLEDGTVVIIRVERGTDDSMVIQKVWEADTTAA